MKVFKRFILIVLAFLLIVLGVGSGCQEHERKTEPRLTVEKEGTYGKKKVPSTDLKKGLRDADQDSGRRPCTSDEDCGEGFSCWHQIPRGPSAGIPGSQETPGRCWNKADIQRVF